jgi:transcriptional activator HAC1
VEKLENERDAINSQNQLLRQRLLQVEEDKFKLKQELMEIRALLTKHTGGELTPEASPSPRMSSELFSESSIKQELDDLPILSTAGQSVDLDATFTPEASPAASDLTEASPSPDVTQHPAAVLCDLQCPSSEASPAPAERWSDEALRDRTQALATQHLFRTLHLSVYSTALTPLCELLASLKKGSRLRITTITPMLFHLILWLISTPKSPLEPRTTSTSSTTPTPPISTTRTPSTSSPSTTPSSTFRTSLLRRFLTCSPALARPLKDATAAALHEKARQALGESPDVQCRADGEQGEAGSGSGARGTASKAEMWRLMTMALVIDQFERERSIKRSERGMDKQIGSRWTCV